MKGLIGGASCLEGGLEDGLPSDAVEPLADDDPEVEVGPEGVDGLDEGADLLLRLLPRLTVDVHRVGRVLPVRVPDEGFHHNESTAAAAQATRKEAKEQRRGGGGGGGGRAWRWAVSQVEGRGGEAEEGTNVGGGCRWRGGGGGGEEEQRRGYYCRRCGLTLPRPSSCWPSSGSSRSGP